MVKQYSWSSISCNLKNKHWINQPSPGAPRAPFWRMSQNYIFYISRFNCVGGFSFYVKVVTTWRAHGPLWLLSAIASNWCDPEKYRNTNELRKLNGPWKAHLNIIMHFNIIIGPQEAAMEWELKRQMIFPQKFELRSNFIPSCSVSLLKSEVGNINAPHTGNPFWMCRFIIQCRFNNTKDENPFLIHFECFALYYTPTNTNPTQIHFECVALLYSAAPTDTKDVEVKEQDKKVLNTPED